MTDTISPEQDNNPIIHDCYNLARDLHDINTMFITPIKQRIKRTKSQKIKWKLFAYAEHTMAVTVGALTLTHAQQPIVIIIGTTGMLIIAHFGFKLSDISNIFKQDLKQLRCILNDTILFLEHANREEINQAANILRQEYQQKQI